MARRFRRNYSLEAPADGAPDQPPAVVDLRDAEEGSESYCGACAFFVAPTELGGEGACVIVEGPIEPDDVCVEFSRRPEPSALGDLLPTPPVGAEDLEPEVPEMPMPEEEPMATVASASPGELRRLDAWRRGEGPRPGLIVASGRFLVGDDVVVVEDDTQGDDVPMTRVAVLMVEGERSADGRYIEPQALTWREPPLTMTLNHDPDQRPALMSVIGRVADLAGLQALATAAQAEKRPITPDEFRALVGDTGEAIVALVEFDQMWGWDVAREVATGKLRGVSVEIGDEDADVIEQPDGTWLYVVHAGKIGAASLTPFQAIESARMLVGEETTTEEVEDGPVVIEIEGDQVEAIAASSMRAGRLTSRDPLFNFVRSRRGLVAGAGPMEPPAEWFQDPGFTDLTPGVIEDDGEFYAHAAPWEVCHIGYSDVCVTAPPSPSGYRYFVKPGAVKCEDGTLVAAGKITLGTGHAPARKGMGWQAAAEHYDHTGTVVADVAIGEDAFGIWVHGRMRPDVTPLQIQQLRAADLSGDWRPVGMNLEMVAALAVNVPGFPVRPNQAIVAGGQQVALFAGTHFARGADGGCGCGGHGDELAAEVRRLGQIVDTLGLGDQAVAQLRASILR